MLTALILMSLYIKCCFLHTCLTNSCFHPLCLDHLCLDHMKREACFWHSSLEQGVFGQVALIMCGAVAHVVSSGSIWRSIIGKCSARPFGSVLCQHKQRFALFCTWLHNGTSTTTIAQVSSANPPMQVDALLLFAHHSHDTMDKGKHGSRTL